MILTMIARSLTVTVFANPRLMITRTAHNPMRSRADRLRIAIFGLLVWLVCSLHFPTSAAEDAPNAIEKSQSTLLGDMDADGALTKTDIRYFSTALDDPKAYAEQFGLIADIVGDMDGNGRLEAADLSVLTNVVASPRRGQPNIVFILVDDLGYGHLGCFGQERVQTPNIDRLAKQGARFTQHYAGATVCGPSRAVLLSGLHAGHIPYRRNAASTPLPNQMLTLMELMKQAGYRTGCFGKWGVGEVGTAEHPNRQGVDEFLGVLHQGHGHAHYPPYLWQNNEKRDLGNRSDHAFRSSLNPEDRVLHTHDAFMDGALKFIRESQDRPFFCYIPLTLVHTEVRATEEAVAPYRKLDWPEYNLNNAPSHLPTKEPRAQFAGMLSMVDDSVGDLMALLDELGIAKNTIVVFTSDNGGQLKRVWGRAPSEWFNANGPLRGGKTESYEGGLRVPLIVRWPDKIRAGSTSMHISYFPDWMPTFADAAGIRTPAGIDGLSFYPALINTSRPDSEHAVQQQHAFLYWEYPVFQGNLPSETRLRQVVRLGEWKGVRHRVGGPVELYHLHHDIDESEDVAETHPEIVARIEKLMETQHRRPAEQPAVLGLEKP